MTAQDLAPEKIYTYADYLTWQFDEMVEIIKGKVFRMSPAPVTKHQRISTNLTLLVAFFFQKRPCQVFHAPFDVRLPKRKDSRDDQILTVVQPDLCVICDESKLDEKGCVGAPDLVMEILSPSTRKKDLQDKFELYQETGVREYWIVHVEETIVEIFYLDEMGLYRLHRIFTNDDTASSHIFPDLQMKLGEIFA
jgi:Uma2 family endonuclease